MPAKGLIGAKDAHGHDRGVRFDYNKTDSGTRRLKTAVRTARAFGKKDDGRAIQQPVEDISQTARAEFAVYWDRVPITQHRTYNGIPEQRLAGEIVNSTGQRAADEWRVQVAGVVSG